MGRCARKQRVGVRVHAAGADALSAKRKQHFCTYVCTSHGAASKPVLARQATRLAAKQHIGARPVPTTAYCAVVLHTLRLGVNGTLLHGRDPGPPGPSLRPMLTARAFKSWRGNGLCGQHPRGLKSCKPGPYS